jgi:tRNA(Ile)-lysidine synthase
VRSFYESALDKIKKDLVEQFPHDLRIPIRKLKKHDTSVILFEILNEYGFTEKQLPEAVKLLDSQSGKFISSATHRLIRHRDWLILAPSTGEAAIVVIPEDLPSVSFSQRTLAWERKTHNGGKPNPSPMTAQLDARDIQFPLLLRPLNEGDYFYPLGMRKKKKISRFLMDLKLSRNEKEKVWVLESDQRILWVVGLRIDDRFKITGSTKELLVFTLTSP